jgi:DNA topoisomerase IA
MFRGHEWGADAADNFQVAPDENASKAVDARQEIDLRIGAAFTRYQTLLLQVSFPSLRAAAW